MKLQINKQYIARNGKIVKILQLVNKKLEIYSGKYVDSKFYLYDLKFFNNGKKFLFTNQDIKIKSRSDLIFNDSKFNRIISMILILGFKLKLKVFPRPIHRINEIKVTRDRDQDFSVEYKHVYLKLGLDKKNNTIMNFKTFKEMEDFWNENGHLNKK